MHAVAGEKVPASQGHLAIDIDMVIAVQYGAVCTPLIGYSMMVNTGIHIRAIKSIPTKEGRFIDPKTITTASLRRVSRCASAAVLYFSVWFSISLILFLLLSLLFKHFSLLLFCKFLTFPLSFKSSLLLLMSFFFLLLLPRFILRIIALFRWVIIAFWWLISAISSSSSSSSCHCSLLGARGFDSRGLVSLRPDCLPPCEMWFFPNDPGAKKHYG